MSCPRPQVAHTILRKRLKSSGDLQDLVTKAPLVTWTVFYKLFTCPRNSVWWSTDGNMTRQKMRQKKTASSTSYKSCLRVSSLFNLILNLKARLTKTYRDSGTHLNSVPPSNGTTRRRCSSTTSRNFVCSSLMPLNSLLSRTAYMGWSANFTKATAQASSNA